ncbi:Uncharacterised protein [uncultured Clostridium sp.]|nr:Uncharacterised protein [uncultured Clostridium sp.]
MIPVNSQHREDTDEIHRLTENIFHGIIRNLIIVGGQRQHALRHGIHDILTWRLHNDISGKILRKSSVFIEFLTEQIQFFLIRKLTHKKEVCYFLKAALSDAVYQIIDLITAEPELTVTGN